MACVFAAFGFGSALPKINDRRTLFGVRRSFRLVFLDIKSPSAHLKPRGIVFKMTGRSPYVDSKRPIDHQYGSGDVIRIRYIFQQ